MTIDLEKLKAATGITYVMHNGEISRLVSLKEIKKERKKNLAISIIIEKEVDLHLIMGIEFDYEWYLIKTKGWDKSFILNKKEFQLVKWLIKNYRHCNL